MSKSLKHIGTVSLLTGISRVLGMVRDFLGLYIFGSSVLYAAWNWAFTLPNLFRRLLAEGSLTTAFIPTIQDELHSGGKEGAYKLLSNVTSWAFVVCGSIVALAAFFFHESYLIPGVSDKWHIGADFAAALFPYLLFISLAAAFNATLNVQHRFLEPALSPIWLNIAMIASLAGAGLHFAKSPMAELHWLTIGVLLGGFLQMMVPAVILVRDGWRPSFDLTMSPWIRKIAAMMGPGIFGTAIYQINITVSRTLALHIDDAGPTLYATANRLMELPIGVFAVAVSTVVYPLIARHAAENNLEKMGDDFRKGLRLIFVINVPAAVGIALLSRPIVTLIYVHGKFTASGGAQLAALVALFGIGMPFFSVANLAIRAFYAVKDTATPVKIAVIDFALNLILSVILMHWLGLKGLVLSSTIAIILQNILLERALRHKLPGLTLAPLLPSALKVVAGALVMGAAVWGGWEFIQGLGYSPMVSSLLAVGILVPLGVAVYGGALWFMKIEGREDLVVIINKVLRRTKPNLPV